MKVKLVYNLPTNLILQNLTSKASTINFQLSVFSFQFKKSFSTRSRSSIRNSHKRYGL